MTGPETSSIALRVASFGDKPFFNMMFHRLDHDDRIVDHQADGQHQPEERQGVDRETEQREKDERADEGDRYGQSGMSVARQPCRKKKTTMMTSTSASKRVFTISLIPSVTARVVSRETGVIEVRRETLLPFLHQLLLPRPGFDRVRTRKLIDGHDGRRVAVEASEGGVVLGPELNAGHVLQSHDRPVRVGPEHDLAELLLGDSGGPERARRR